MLHQKPLLAMDMSRSCRPPKNLSLEGLLHAIKKLTAHLLEVAFIYASLLASDRERYDVFIAFCKCYLSCCAAHLVFLIIVIWSLFLASRCLLCFGLQMLHYEGRLGDEQFHIDTSPLRN